MKLEDGRPIKMVKFYLNSSEDRKKKRESKSALNSIQKKAIFLKKQGARTIYF